MYIRKCIFLLLIVLMCIGCTHNFTKEAYQENSQNFRYTRIEPNNSLIGEYSEEVYDSVEVDDILTLNQALALTLLHNPELKAFSLETRAAQARLLQAGLWPNPEIEIETENIGGTGELRGFNGAETTYQVSQLIEPGKKLQKRSNVAFLESKLADIDFQKERLRIFSEVNKSFISVLLAQEKLQLSEELLTLSTESYETVETMVDAGKDSPVEKTRASVALTNIKIAHREAQQNLDFARNKLSSFWNQGETIFDRVSGDIFTIEELPVFNELKEHLEFNPEYIKWETEIKKRQAQLDLEKSKSIGDISLGAGLKRFNETDDHAFVLGLSIPFPIFDRNQGAKQEAAYNLAKSKQQQKAALLKLQNEFNESYLEFINSYTLANSMKNEVIPAATEMYEASATAYEEGKVDYLNVLDAQRTLFDFQNEYIEALAVYHITKIEIERLTGIKTEPADNIESER